MEENRKISYRSLLPNREEKKKETIVTMESVRSRQENMFYRNYGKGPRWLPGTVTEVRGRVIRMVESDGGMMKRHTNQLQMRIVEEDTGSNQASGDESHPNQPRVLRSVMPGDRRHPPRNRYPPNRYGFSE